MTCLETLKHKENTEAEDESPVPLWLLTFADVMALMLTFFVLLYSMSSLDEGKWQKLTDAAGEGEESFLAQKMNAGDSVALEIDRVDYRSALSISYVQTLLTKAAVNNDALKDMRIRPVQDRLVVSLPADALFAPGQAILTDEGVATLRALSPYLTRIRNSIEIVGHADPTPIGDRNVYKSNRALSLARAVYTADAMVNEGYNRDISVKGLSGSRFFVLPDLQDTDDKNALARRVDIVILKTTESYRRKITVE